MFNAIIERCNAFAQTWALWVGMSIVDAAIVLAIVSLVWWAIRRKAPPQLGYFLFLLVPLKLFVPDVEAKAGQPFALTVLDAEGKPVPQATVEFRTDAKLTAEQVQRGKLKGKKAGSNYGGVPIQTDATGRIDLNLPHAPKRFVVLIQMPGYGPFWAEWSSTEHPISIPPKFTANLDAGWSVGGVLVDDQGKPIRAQRSDCPSSSEKPPGDTSELYLGTTPVTDAEGKWRFDSVPASVKEFSVEITHPDFKASRGRLSRSQFGIAAGGKPATKIMIAARLDRYGQSD